MVLPSGTRLPPPGYAAAVVAAAGAVAFALRRADPRVDDRTVAALAPWMAAGSGLYVLRQLALPPAIVAPFLESPTVYLSTFAIAGATWLLALRDGREAERALAVAGTLAFLLVAAVATADGLRRGTFGPLPSLGALLVALVLAAVVWIALGRAYPGDAAATGVAGALVVFGHALDGVSTAVGISQLGFGERTPLSRLILRLTEAALPDLPYFGFGWLFVLVKVGFAAGLVVLLAEHVRERPREGFLLLALVAAVGLGPGAHNLLLFAVVEPGP